MSSDLQHKSIPAKKLVADRVVRLRYQQLPPGNRGMGGGMLAEYHFLILDDDNEIQLPYNAWKLYHVGEPYPRDSSKE